jgi:SAM-dependent methyltransferase
MHATADTQTHGETRNVRQNVPIPRSRPEQLGLRAVGFLPKGKLRKKLALQLQRRAYRRAVANVFGRSRLKPPLEAPVPPLELIAQSYGFTMSDAEEFAEPSNYLAAGYALGLSVLRLVAESGRDPRTVDAVLDYGSASGRTLRAWREIAGLRLVGADINEELILWAQRHLDDIEFHHTETTPPLRFEDSSFDVIWSQSPFAHIPLDQQAAWLQELRRVLRPEGMLMVTLAGEGQARHQLTPDQQQQLERDGALEIDSGAAGLSSASRLTGQLDVFMTRAEATHRFGSELDFVDYRPSPTGQDIIILRRPPA